MIVVFDKCYTEIFSCMRTNIFFIVKNNRKASIFSKIFYIPIRDTVYFQFRHNYLNSKKGESINSRLDFTVSRLLVGKHLILQLPIYW